MHSMSPQDHQRMAGAAPDREKAYADLAAFVAGRPDWVMVPNRGGRWDPYGKRLLVVPGVGEWTLVVWPALRTPARRAGAYWMAQVRAGGIQGDIVDEMYAHRDAVMASMSWAERTLSIALPKVVACTTPDEVAGLTAVLSRRQINFMGMAVSPTSRGRADCLEEVIYRITGKRIVGGAR